MLLERNAASHHRQQVADHQLWHPDAGSPQPWRGGNPPASAGRPSPRHGRVAAVQQHLHSSGCADHRDWRLYPATSFAVLLADPPIGESRPATIDVVADTGFALSADAVSLGLIVTELVINALKYAFPDQSKSATVTVRYETGCMDWKLSVHRSMASGARDAIPRAAPQGRSGHQPGQGAGASTGRQGGNRQQSRRHESLGRARNLCFAHGGLTASSSWLWKRQTRRCSDCLVRTGRTRLQGCSI